MQPSVFFTQYCKRMNRGFYLRCHSRRGSHAA